MQHIDLILGSTLMLLGVALLAAAIIRALRREWGLGAREIWVLPTAGICLVLLGRWLIQ